MLSNECVGAFLYICVYVDRYVCVIYSQVQNKRGGTFNFFVSFGDPPPQLILTPPFINFSNFSRDYTEVHKYIIDS